LVTTRDGQVFTIACLGGTAIHRARIAIVTSDFLGGGTLASHAITLGGTGVTVFTRQATGASRRDTTARAGVAEVDGTRRAVVTNHGFAKTNATGTAVAAGTGVVVGTSGVGQWDKLALALLALLNGAGVAVTAL
jgi:hypothetical protein